MRMQSKFEEITALTDVFCDKHLNAEYADMSRQLTAALCCLHPPPWNRNPGRTHKFFYISIWLISVTEISRL